MRRVTYPSLPLASRVTPRNALGEQLVMVRENLVVFQRTEPC